MGTEPPEVAQCGRTASGVLLDVVDLEVPAYATARDVALATLDQERSAKVRVHVTAEVSDRRDVGALLDDRGEEGVAQQVAGPSCLDRPDAGDLAAFSREGFTSDERSVVDDHVHGCCGAGAWLAMP